MRDFLKPKGSVFEQTILPGCLFHCLNQIFSFPKLHLKTDVKHSQDNDDYWMAFGSGDITICFPGVAC